MLEYQKLILDKVSFSSELFKKELVKSKKWLNKNEFKELMLWIETKFDKGFINNSLAYKNDVAA